MIIDCFTFNGEFDLLELRLNMLKDRVDRFIIVEFDKTFSGKDKPFYYREQRERFEKITDKISYCTFGEEFYEKYRALAESSPNTKGADHWKREFMQKECIKDALVGLEDDDIVYIGDVDEIWVNGFLVEPITKIKLRVYTYHLNNRSSEEFWGTLVAKYKDIKDKCLNHVRSTDHYKTKGCYGWHFTSMGGYDEVKRKLSDSYTPESYWTPEVQGKLGQNMANNKDFLGRGFTYKKDESEWPQFLKDNKEKYAGLCL